MKSKVIVITGSIATGKSLVSSYLREKGFKIIDADEIAHLLMQVGQVNYKNIVEYFGEEILDSNKNIDNKKLAHIVFNNKEELQVLNNLTHDNIFNKIMNEINNSNEDIIFVDIPLFIENIGKNNIPVDEMWLVYTDENTQLQRLMKRNNLSQDQALSRIKSQMSIEDKLKFADFVIDNTGNKDDTKRQVKEKLRTL
ncbi:dephospho-CoA kinase [uncultured Helcococcus sp.]|uniref:dephospho-CoA kinase n=1 Tax=uncultured Helcococcus sp. TaxID=1072508 RepID=UPI00260FE2D8|nr:dephospho-CoA kinase [uncultured Helcococcus sp.]